MSRYGEYDGDEEEEEEKYEDEDTTDSTIRFIFCCDILKTQNFNRFLFLFPNHVHPIIYFQSSAYYP